jgi:hypothetical protein
LFILNGGKEDRILTLYGIIPNVENVNDISVKNKINYYIKRINKNKNKIKIFYHLKNPHFC